MREIQTLAFKDEYLPTTVRHLKARLNVLAADEENGGPHTKEQRVITATLHAIYTEYSPTYFDGPIWP